MAQTAAGMVTDAAIGEVIGGDDPEQVVDDLVKIAYAEGGLDNITIILADVVDDGPAGETMVLGAAAEIDLDVAAVTDLSGHQTGAHRTWLAPDGSGKAPVETPRRAMGDLLGHAVRFDTAAEVLVAGEGIETVLSPRQVLPHMPMLAALSAAHLAAILFPPSLRRLYVLRDRDPAGDGARDSLASRAASFGIEAVTLTPVEGDFNDDLRRLGADALRAARKDQLHPEDIRRFMER